MFSKATANFVRQIDPEGSLIHVSRVNNSHKLVPMALVVKRNRIWFWQKPKYLPTDFTLGDLLQGDVELTPGVSEKEFLSYKGIYGDKLTGNIDAEAGYISVAVEGQGVCKLQSCFGKLKKEELDVKKLLHDSRKRLVDMQHVLVQQLEKRAEVLAVVKERILTTDSCIVTQTKKEQCIFQGVFGLVGLLSGSAKVCVKDSNNMEMDSDVSLEIPPGTVIAYSILEMEIKKNGQYELCLQPGILGGFEEDTVWTSESMDSVDGKDQRGSQEMYLSPLAELPQSTQYDFIKKLQETMKDRAALLYLQCVLEELCGGEPLEDSPEFQSSSLSAFLDPAGSDNNTNHGLCGLPAHLQAAHLLVSAMEELPDKTLNLLSDSHPDFLEAFDMLLFSLKKNNQPLSVQSLPALLQNSQAFQGAEQLLNSIHVTLKRDGDRLWMETGNDAGALPLVLCLSVRGLSLLCTGLRKS
ncbi:gasdermin-E-like [Parambassis ranga]|uniref:Gasdermin-E-like n=1 Tax=Parambassis ranga TaxID=210632 RepID=A0A6P7KBB6_9TELE|nr:gasdermin-E-like [Parambassis ranga]